MSTNKQRQDWSPFTSPDTYLSVELSLKTINLNFQRFVFVKKILQTTTLCDDQQQYNMQTCFCWVWGVQWLIRGTWTCSCSWSSGCMECFDASSSCLTFCSSCMTFCCSCSLKKIESFRLLWRFWISLFLEVISFSTAISLFCRSERDKGDTWWAASTEL